MGGACSTYGEEERCIQDLGGETCGKETRWKTQAWIVGYYNESSRSGVGGID